MDTVSASAVAAKLGTTIPRAKRAMVRLGIVDPGHRGRVGIGEGDVARLQDELGTRSRAGEFSPTETSVLAALARTPLGAVSARAVARKAGISPTAAGNALRRLVDADAVTARRERIAMGNAREVLVYRIDPFAHGADRIAEAISGVAPRRRPTRGPEPRVPPSLRHLFWNTASEQLETAAHGSSIARRLLLTGDLDGLAWGRANLQAADWLAASEGRGLDPRDRALARNIARSLDAAG